MAGTDTLEAPPSAAQPDAPFAVGAVLGGNFELRGILGQGGMSRVYDAFDRALGRTVAIKLVLPGVDPEYLLREARALAPIRHRSIVAVYALLQHEDVPFLVMERVYGRSLHEHALRVRRTEGALAIEEVIRLLSQLAEALALIHASGLSHRDLKPSNVMLTPDGRVVLIDFALGTPETLVNADDDRSVGSAGYLAPEAIAGDVRPGDGALLDLYALGVIAFELLTGGLPFHGATDAEILRQQLVEPAPDVRKLRPEVPAQLAELVASLLVKSPRERASHAETVLWQLQSIGERASPLRVLIVDDDRSLLPLLRATVHAASPDAQIETAADGEQALRRISAAPPDLLLVDLALPRASGMEVCLYARGTAKRCRIVALSGRAAAADVELLLQIGVSRFVPKDAGLQAALLEIIGDMAKLGELR
jgi:serine/threonine-protein kinase